MDQANAGATSRLVDACGCDLDSTKTAFQSFHKNSKTWNLGLFIVLFSEFETYTNRRQIGTPFNHQTRPRQSEKIKGSCSSELKCGKDFSTGDPWEYPLVNVNKKLWNITIFNGKTHYKLPCSIAMLVCQRVLGISHRDSTRRRAALGASCCTLGADRTRWSAKIDKTYLAATASWLQQSTGWWFQPTIVVNILLIYG